jgi:hypothetical protein
VGRASRSWISGEVVHQASLSDGYFGATWKKSTSPEGMCHTFDVVAVGVCPSLDFATCTHEEVENWAAKPLIRLAVLAKLGSATILRLI